MKWILLLAALSAGIIGLVAVNAATLPGSSAGPVFRVGDNDSVKVGTVRFTENITYVHVDVENALVGHKSPYAKTDKFPGYKCREVVMYGTKPFAYKAWFRNGLNTGTLWAQVDTVQAMGAKWGHAAAAEIRFPCFAVVEGELDSLKITNTAADTVRAVLNFGL
jgi:hypothetical protein